MILHVYICVVDVKLSTMSEHVEYVTQCVNFYPRDARHQSHCITCYTVFIVIFIFLFCRGACVRTNTLVVTVLSVPMEDGELTVYYARLACTDFAILTLVHLSTFVFG